MDLEHRHRVGSGTVDLVQVAAARDARDGGDAIPSVTCHAIGHEAPIGMAQQRHTLGVDVEVLLGFVDESEQVALIVHAGTVIVATGRRRVPKVQPFGIDRAIGDQQDKPPVVHVAAHTQVHVLYRSGGRVPVQQDQHGPALVGRITVRQIIDRRSIAAQLLGGRWVGRGSRVGYGGRVRCADVVRGRRVARIFGSGVAATSQNDGHQRHHGQCSCVDHSCIISALSAGVQERWVT